MPLSDYAHWNEDAERIWWEEEGKHAPEPPDPQDDDYLGGPEDWECEDPPHTCMSNGNYEQLAGNIWCCSDCGHRFHIQWEPEHEVTPLPLTLGEVLDMYEQHGVETIYTPRF